MLKVWWLNINILYFVQPNPDYFTNIRLRLLWMQTLKGTAVAIDSLVIMSLKESSCFLITTHFTG